MIGLAGDEFITSIGAQATAITGIAVALGWWVRRVVKWWKKMRVWQSAVAQERFAERFAQHLDAVIAPRFDDLGNRIASVEDKFQLHLDEAEKRREREDAQTEERQVLFAALRKHMDAEEGK